MFRSSWELIVTKAHTKNWWKGPKEKSISSKSALGTTWFTLGLSELRQLANSFIYFSLKLRLIRFQLRWKANFKGFPSILFTSPDSQHERSYYCSCKPICIAHKLSHNLRSFTMSSLPKRHWVDFLYFYALSISFIGLWFYMRPFCTYFSISSLSFQILLSNPNNMETRHKITWKSIDKPTKYHANMY